MKRLFFGGIHPKYNKEMSTGITSFHTVTPKQVVIPLLQHIGAPCKPLVQVGDRVLMGQKIGDGEGLCVPVHASVSGTVVAIEPRPHVSGRQILAVVIDNDGMNEAVPTVPADLDSLSNDEILHRVREAGIVGMGGAAFPGNVKALSAIGNVDTLIANACECEPYITADDFMLRTAAEDVLKGMRILKRLLNPGRVVLAVEDNKAEAIAKVNSLKKEFPDIELAILPTMYPQGAEKQLIQSVTGREVKPGQLPVSVGCAVFNVSTFASIYRAVCLGQPLTRRIVTVSGEAIADPQNFLVPLGTTFHDLIEVAGGLMMGIAQKDLSVPVVKASNCVLCLLKDQNGAAENPVCLRCGKCVSVCPMRLQPLYMYRFENAGRLDELERLHLMDCMECGSCAFTCPGKLPLVEHFRRGKAKLKEAKSK